MEKIKTQEKSLLIIVPNLFWFILRLSDVFVQSVCAEVFLHKHCNLIIPATYRNQNHAPKKNKWWFIVLLVCFPANGETELDPQSNSNPNLLLRA